MIDDGVAVIVTEVTVTRGAIGFTVTVAVPDFVGSCTEVAVTVTVVDALTVAEVKTPEDAIVPAAEGLALQVTAEL